MKIDTKILFVDYLIKLGYTVEKNSIRETPTTFSADLVEDEVTEKHFDQITRVEGKTHIVIEKHKWRKDLTGTN